MRLQIIMVAWIRNRSKFVTIINDDCLIKHFLRLKLMIQNIYFFKDLKCRLSWNQSYQILVSRVPGGELQHGGRESLGQRLQGGVQGGDGGRGGGGPRQLEAVPRASLHAQLPVAHFQQLVRVYGLQGLRRGAESIARDPPQRHTFRRLFILLRFISNRHAVSLNDDQS